LANASTQFEGQVEAIVREYQLYQAVADIAHTHTQAKSPQTNGSCERCHKTVVNEFYSVAFG